MCYYPNYLLTFQKEKKGRKIKGQKEVEVLGKSLRVTFSKDYLMSMSTRPKRCACGSGPVLTTQEASLAQPKHTHESPLTPQSVSVRCWNLFLPRKEWSQHSGLWAILGSQSSMGWLARTQLYADVTVSHTNTAPRSKLNVYSIQNFLLASSKTYPYTNL